MVRICIFLIKLASLFSCHKGGAYSKNALIFGFQIFDPKLIKSPDDFNIALCLHCRKDIRRGKEGANRKDCGTRGRQQHLERALGEVVSTQYSSSFTNYSLFCPSVYKFSLNNFILFSILKSLNLKYSFLKKRKKIWSILGLNGGLLRTQPIFCY